MNAPADIRAFLSSLLDGIIMLWTVLSVIRIIVFDASCDPRMRKGWGLRSLTDALPWAATRAYSRVVGMPPPAWVPWVFAVVAYYLAVCLCELAIDYRVVSAS
jgi:hypothetical protein